MCDLQLDYICTYKDITEEGEDEIGLKQMCYQLQLLQAFNMYEFDDNEIDKNITHVYTQLKDISFVQELIMKNPYKFADKATMDLAVETLGNLLFVDEPGGRRILPTWKQKERLLSWP